MLTLLCAIFACSLGYVGGGCMAAGKLQDLERQYLYMAQIARKIVGPLPLSRQMQGAEVLIAGEDLLDLWSALESLEQREQGPFLPPPSTPPALLAFG